jgi:ribosomal protein S18 acetylase RimI-like enzyme
MSEHAMRDVAPHDTMRIVRGEARHVEPVWAIIARCRDALAAEGIAQWDDVYPTRAMVEEDVARGALSVLEDDRACLGCIVLDERQSDAYASVAWTGGEPALVVHRLCIDPATQGRGLGHRLMAFAESEAARLGYASIRLDAYSGNPHSVRFYRARGYREAGMVAFARRPLLFHCFELPVGSVD